MFKPSIISLIVIIFIYKICFGNVNKERIIKYLQDFRSLTQNLFVNNNGGVLSGKILINRPGKARIEYNEILMLLVTEKICNNKQRIKIDSFLQSQIFL